MLGIGAQHTKDPNGIAWKQNRDFENLLERLNANSEDPTGGGVDSVPIDGFQRACVHGPTIGLAKTGSETEGRDEPGQVKEKESKKKKRPRDYCEITKTEKNKSKKQKQVESTSIPPAIEPVEEGPSNSNCLTQAIPFVMIYLSCKMPSLTFGFQHL